MTVDSSEQEALSSEALSDEALIAELRRRAPRWECERSFTLAERQWLCSQDQPLALSSWEQALLCFAPHLGAAEHDALYEFGLAETLGRADVGVKLMAGWNAPFWDRNHPITTGVAEHELQRELQRELYRQRQVQQRPQLQEAAERSQRDAKAEWRRRCDGEPPTSEPTTGEPSAADERRLRVLCQRRAGRAGRSHGHAFSFPPIGLMRSEHFVPAGLRTADQVLELTRPFLPERRTQADFQVLSELTDVLSHSRPGRPHWSDEGKDELQALARERLDPNHPGEQRVLAAFEHLMAIWPRPRLVLSVLYLIGAGEHALERALRANLLMALSGGRTPSFPEQSYETQAALKGRWPAWSLEQRHAIGGAAGSARAQLCRPYRFFDPVHVHRRLLEAPGSGPQKGGRLDERAMDLARRLLATELLRG